MPASHDDGSFSVKVSPVKTVDEAHETTSKTARIDSFFIKKIIPLPLAQSTCYNIVDMKKTLVVCMMLAILCSCGAPKATWDDIYRMVDDGKTYKADLDEVIKAVGPETHPASQVVTKFFNALIAGKPEEAWKYVENNSPFMQTRKDYDSFQDLYKKVSKENEYKEVKISSVEVGKLAGGVRMIKVYYVFTYLIKSRNETAKAEGAYNMSNLTGEWMIFSEDK